jgi:hypothetical protein
LPDELKARPILFFSAEDDPIVSSAKTKVIAESLPHGKFYSAGKILTDGV